MNSGFSKYSYVLRSARLFLWVPITMNVGFLVFSFTHSIWSAALLSFSLCTIASYGFLINDIWDLPIDRRNKAGKLETAPQDVLNLALLAAATFLILGLVMSIFLGIQAFFPLVVVAAGLSAYTLWIRPKLFFANFLAALLASTPLWLPNIVFARAPDFSQCIVITVVILMLLGREVIFDSADFFGDAQMNRRTFPVVFGKQVATRIAVVWQFSGLALLVFWCLSIITTLPFEMRLLVWGTLAVLACLVVPINLRLLKNGTDRVLVHHFTLRTRLAMLLVPLLLFVLLGK